MANGGADQIWVSEHGARVRRSDRQPNTLYYRMVDDEIDPELPIVLVSDSSDAWPYAKLKINQVPIPARLELRLLTIAEQLGTAAVRSEVG